MELKTPCFAQGETKAISLRTGLERGCRERSVGVGGRLLIPEHWSWIWVQFYQTFTGQVPRGTWVT